MGALPGVCHLPRQRRVAGVCGEASVSPVADQNILGSLYNSKTFFLFKCGSKAYGQNENSAEYTVFLFFLLYCMFFFGLSQMTFVAFCEVCRVVNVNVSVV